MLASSGLVVSVLINAGVVTCVKSLMIDSATDLNLLDLPNSPDKIALTCAYQDVMCHVMCDSGSHDEA